MRNLQGVASAGEPQFNDAKTVAIVFVTPDSAPQDEETGQLVDRLRDEVVPAATEGSEALVYVSGLNAAFKDIGDRIYERLPWFLLYVIGVTFLVLAMAFRSIVVSLTAAISTILSAFVGFGVLTLVIQEGYLMELTGLDRTGPIETFVPPIAFAILFGLSMDYMVFLMSRIREEHVHGLKTKEAIEHGIAAIGRVVVAAALIMGTVFAAFILTSDRISKEFGLLLAVAIPTDALVVKMTLIPSFFTLLGEKTWYIPRWLDRLLPGITIEPPHDEEGRATFEPEPQPRNRLREAERGEAAEPNAPPPAHASPDRHFVGDFGMPSRILSLNPLHNFVRCSILRRRRITPTTMIKTTDSQLFLAGAAYAASSLAPAECQAERSPSIRQPSLGGVRASILAAYPASRGRPVVVAFVVSEANRATTRGDAQLEEDIGRIEAPPERERLLCTEVGMSAGN